MLLAVSLVTPTGALTDEFVPYRLLNEKGEVVYQVDIEPTNPALMRVTHYYRLSDAVPSEDAAKPGSGGADPGTDCESDAYKTTGWYWTKAYSAYADNYVSTLNAAGKAWDDQTGFALFGGYTSGTKGNAGTQDFVNQVQFKYLDGSSTVAVTYTWAYRSTGEAVESDAVYNTYYKFATDGSSDAMDVGHVGTHEIGHTFGLDHPTSTSSNTCLTMYAYVNYGQTHQRTLGDGDILGIKAIYGN